MEENRTRGYIGIVMGTRGGPGKKEWRWGQESRARGVKTTGGTNHCNKDTVGGSIGAEDICSVWTVSLGFPRISSQDENSYASSLFVR